MALNYYQFADLDLVCLRDVLSLERHRWHNYGEFQEHTSVTECGFVQLNPLSLLSPLIEVLVCQL
jgi:hypothetical protein